MRVLLIDNYDSFAWNLVQALRMLGAEVVVRRNDAVTVREALEPGWDPSPGVAGAAVDAAADAIVDAIVLSPGPKGPSDAGVSVPLVLAAAARGVPLLGVCLGHQAIGEAFGGRVVHAARLLHGKTSEIRHDGRGEFRGVPSPFTAMRYHSLAVAEPLPDCLVRSAWTGSSASDAGGELMALRHRVAPIVGWQFHPESYLTPEGPRLLGNFLERVAGRAEPAGTTP